MYEYVRSERINTKINYIITTFLEARCFRSVFIFQIIYSVVTKFIDFCAISHFPKYIFQFAFTFISVGATDFVGSTSHYVAHIVFVFFVSSRRSGIFNGTLDDFKANK